VTKAYSETRLADWMFLFILWIAGITGFWLEISVALNANYLVNHIVLLIHTIISMELVLVVCFFKVCPCSLQALSHCFSISEKTRK
jgi:hypothetical protein